MVNIQCETIPQCWQAVEASAWTAPKHRRRVLSMPIGLVCKSKSNEINITFGLLAGVHGGVSLIYAAGIRTWWKGRWWWKGWNWTWTPISDCHIRICDQWGWILVNIPIWMFVPKAMCMTNKLLTDKKRNVQTCDDDDSCDEWVICQNIFQTLAYFAVHSFVHLDLTSQDSTASKFSH